MKKRLALLLIISGPVIGAGFLFVRHPGLFTVLKLAGATRAALPVPERYTLKSAGKTQQITRYLGNPRFSGRSAVVFYGLTHHAENHPALKRFVAALLPHYGAVYIPELRGMTEYDMQSGRSDVHTALHSVGDQLKDYDAFAFCVAGSFLTEALFNRPPANLPRRVFLHSPFTDGQTVTEHYRTTAINDLDAGALLTLAANSESFSAAERSEIKVLLRSLPPGEASLSQIENILKPGLWRRIASLRDWKSRFLQEYHLAEFIQKPNPAQFFMMASRGDRVMPFHEAEKLCTRIKSQARCEIHVGNAGTHTGTKSKGFITEFLDLADFFERVFSGGE